MKYLTEIVFSAVACGILTLVTPEGKSNIGKYVKYAATLAFLCMTVSPLVNSTQSLPGIFSDISSIHDEQSLIDTEETNDEIHYGNLEIVSSEICKAAADSASEHFGVPKDDFSIKLIIDKNDSGYLIREVVIYPKGEALKIDKGTLKNFFKSILNSEVKVVHNGA